MTYCGEAAGLTPAAGLDPAAGVFIGVALGIGSGEVPGLGLGLMPVVEGLPPGLGAVPFPGLVFELPGLVGFAPGSPEFVAPPVFAPPPVLPAPAPPPAAPPPAWAIRVPLLTPPLSPKVAAPMVASPAVIAHAIDFFQRAEWSLFFMKYVSTDGWLGTGGANANAPRQMIRDGGKKVISSGAKFSQLSLRLTPS